MKNWDLFISHASEDKDEVVTPLAKALQESGLRIWLDVQQLYIGDSIRERIDEGLALSHYGIVVISPNFMLKDWPRKELNGLFALEEDGEKVILPLWFNIQKKQLTQYSPILADRLAANWDSGIDKVVKDITSVIYKRAKDENSNILSIKGRFSKLLDNNKSIIPIRSFLSTHRYIIEKSTMHSMSTSLYDYQYPSPLMKIADFVSVYYHDSARQYKWHAIFLASPQALLLNEAGEPSNALNDASNRIIEFCELVCKRGNINSLLCTVVMGRRSLLKETDRTFIKSFRPADLKATIKTWKGYENPVSCFEPIDTAIRTYDWLLELA